MGVQEEWDRYLECNPLPDVEKVSSLNTYLSAVREVDEDQVFLRLSFPDTTCDVDVSGNTHIGPHVCFSEFGAAALAYEGRVGAVRND